MAQTVAQRRAKGRANVRAMKRRTKRLPVSKPKRIPRATPSQRRRTARTIPRAGGRPVKSSLKPDVRFPSRDKNVLDRIKQVPRFTSEGARVNQRERLFQQAQQGDITNKQFAQGIQTSRDPKGFMRSSVSVKNRDDINKLSTTINPATGQPYITTEQANASLAQLERGAAGVDPFGFGGEQANRDEQGNLLIQTIDSGNDVIPTERQDPFGEGIASTPLSEGTGAGAMGQEGATGVSSFEKGEGVTKEFNINTELKNIDKEYAEGVKNLAGSANPAMARDALERDRQTKIDQAYQKEDQRVKTETKAKEFAEFRKGDTTTSAVASPIDMATSAVGSQYNTAISGMQSIVGQMTGADQAMGNFIMSGLQGELAGINQQVSSNADFASALLDGGVVNIGGQQVALQGNQIYDNIQQSMNNLANQFQNQNAQMNNLSQGMMAENQQYLENQETAQLNKLAWQQQKMERDLEGQKEEAHNAMIAQMALGGGFGQDLALQAVRDSDQEFEDKIRDIGTEFAYARADLSVKFSGLQIQNKQNYVNQVMQNTKDMQASLLTIANQSWANTRAKATAEQNIMTNYFNSVSEARKERANTTRFYAKQMTDIVVSSRKEKADQKKLLWDRWFQHRTQDGNLNQGLSNQIIKQMQDAGIDTSGIDPDTMTLSQSNEVARIQREKEKASGKKPLSQQIQQLVDVDKAFNLLDSTSKAIEEYAGVGGPIAGRTGIGDIEPGKFASAVGLGADTLTAISPNLLGKPFLRQREAVATFNLTKQVIGKALEGGVLRKEDELKYERLLPTLRDPDSLRRFKLKQLRTLMEEGKKSLLDNMNRSGFDVSGFDFDSQGSPNDSLQEVENGQLTNEEAQDILRSIDSGQPLGSDSPTKFIDTLAKAHVKHEGFGTPNAVTITTGNNPGALKFLPHMASKYGAAKGKNNFAMFPDVNSGYRALIGDLRAKITGKSAHIDYSRNPTLLDYIKVYAPATDNNNPTAYSRAVVKFLKDSGYEDVNINTPLITLSHLV